MALDSGSSILTQLASSIVAFELTLQDHGGYENGMNRGKGRSV